MIDVLDEFAPNEYVIKPHPRLNTLYGKMVKTKEVIPSHIPLQFLLAHEWDIVIGFDSGSLISAVQNTSAEVISLMDAVNYSNEDVRKKFRDNLVVNSQNKIKFINEIGELKKILNNNKKTNSTNEISFTCQNYILSNLHKKYI